MNENKNILTIKSYKILKLEEEKKIFIGAIFFFFKGKNQKSKSFAGFLRVLNNFFKVHNRNKELSNDETNKKIFFFYRLKKKITMIFPFKVFFLGYKKKIYFNVRNNFICA